MKQIKLFLILALILFFTKVENRLNKKKKKLNMKKIQLKKLTYDEFIGEIKKYK